MRAARLVGAAFGAWYISICGAVELPTHTTEAVVALRAFAPGGVTRRGSAVRVAPGKLVTNCHVVAGAGRIEIVREGHLSAAQLERQSIERDVCVLSTNDAGVPAVGGRPSPGQRVYAVGFPASAGLTVTKGYVVALHAHDGGHVIQTSAPFDHGASGGALFDDDGRLVGILAFRARVGGRFHFALPLEWFQDDAAAAPRKVPSKVPFWQAKSSELPAFLRAAALEAASNRKDFVEPAYTVSGIAGERTVR